MATNTIQIFITNTNIINVPTEISNTILKVIEMPSKPWWEKLLVVINPFLTLASIAVSAFIGWLAYNIYKQQLAQSKIQLLQELTIKRIELGSRYIATVAIPESNHQEKHKELFIIVYSYAEIFTLLCSLESFLDTKELKDLKKTFITDPLKNFIRGMYSEFLKILASNLDDKTPTYKLPPEVINYCEKHGIEIPKQ